MSGVYNILDQIIAERADTTQECRDMLNNISAHLNSEKNWDELSDKEQGCLVIWEQDCEAHDKPVRKDT